ncbi:MAG: anaerobic ribonucleoside-triphosphate reductase activating protein [Proteobacteria bacterium]|nr:anaerobic ribonucleoside-triphosphate reductase activating protein [Pseudomonadota bacterium]MCL2307052.1 anaerobic ribonucleoside-triphosphate reductase activating protein [Pseudomonadota bacterium]
MNDPFTPLMKAPLSSALRVGGLVPFTATDYPDTLAAVVFCQGCPWRCSYCHNPHLIPTQGEHLLDWPTISEWLETRRGLLDAVVFSGGEPTAQPALLKAVTATRAQGFQIGLHTGGAYPRRLQTLLPHLDWVGLDIKASPAGYARVTGVADSELGAFKALTLIQRAGVPFEVRTTIHGALTPPEELQTLAAILNERGVMHWVLQRFRAQGCDNEELLARADEALILDEALLQALREFVPQIDVRH